MAEKSGITDNLRRRKYTFCRDFFASLVWLSILASVNQTAADPVLSILPYILPVVFMGWRWGAGWGFLLAAIASLAAVPGSYTADHDLNDLYWAGFTTYLKLSCITAGLTFGKRLYESRTESASSDR